MPFACPRNYGAESGCHAGTVGQRRVTHTKVKGIIKVTCKRTIKTCVKG